MIPNLMAKVANQDDLIEKYKPYLTSQAKIENLKNILINLMLDSKNILKNEEYVNILFKLCSELRADLLNTTEFYSNLPIKYCLQNLDVLKQVKRHHAIALIYNLNNEYEDAFEIWKKWKKKLFKIFFSIFINFKIFF